MDEKIKNLIYSKESDQNKEKVEKEILLAALLHDIGKIYLRATSISPLDQDLYTGDHATISGKFIRKLRANIEKYGLNVENIAWLAENHHNKDDSTKNTSMNILSSGYDKYLRIIKTADSISAGARVTGSTLGKSYKTVQYASIFNEFRDIKDSSELMCYNFEKFNESVEAVEKSKLDNIKSGEYIKSLLEDVRKAADRNSNFSRFIEDLKQVLFEYTWCCPSAYQEVIPDTSLYDHLMTTAAIAYAIAKQTSLASSRNDFKVCILKITKNIESASCEQRNIEGSIKDNIEKCVFDNGYTTVSKLTGYSNIEYWVVSQRDKQNTVDDLESLSKNLMTESRGHNYLIIESKALDSAQSLKDSFKGSDAFETDNVDADYRLVNKIKTEEFIDSDGDNQPHRQTIDELASSKNEVASRYLKVEVKLKIKDQQQKMLDKSVSAMATYQRMIDRAIDILTDGAAYVDEKDSLIVMYYDLATGVGTFYNNIKAVNKFVLKTIKIAIRFSMTAGLNSQSEKIDIKLGELTTLSTYIKELKAVRKAGISSSLLDRLMRIESSDAAMYQYIIRDIDPNMSKYITSICNDINAADSSKLKWLKYAVKIESYAYRRKRA